MRNFIVAACLVAITLNSCPASGADVIATVEPKQPAQLPSNDFDELYGSVHFRIGQPYRGTDRNDVFSFPTALYHGFRQLAVVLDNDIFKFAGKIKSSFLLTMEILPSQSNEPLFRVPIATISKEEEYVFFMPKNPKKAFELDKNRTVAEYIPVTSGDVNKLRVRLQAYAVADGMFDLSVLKQVVEFGNQAKALDPIAKAALSPTVEAAFKSIEGILNAIFKTSDQHTIGNTVELSFIEKGSGGNSNAATFILHIPNFVAREGRNKFDVKNMKLPIDISLNTEVTRVSGPSSILKKTTIKVGTAVTPLWDSLRTSNDAAVRSFLDELDGPQQKFTGAPNSEPFCQKFYDAAARHMVAKDAALYYLAFFTDFRAQIAASNGPDGCSGADPNSGIGKRLRAAGLQINSDGKDIKSVHIKTPEFVIVPRFESKIIDKNKFPVLSD